MKGKFIQTNNLIILLNNIQIFKLEKIYSTEKPKNIIKRTIYENNNPNSTYVATENQEDCSD